MIVAATEMIFATTDYIVAVIDRIDALIEDIIIVVVNFVVFILRVFDGIEKEGEAIEIRARGAFSKGMLDRVAGWPVIAGTNGYPVRGGCQLSCRKSTSGESTLQG